MNKAQLCRHLVRLLPEPGPHGEGRETVQPRRPPASSWRNCNASCVRELTDAGQEASGHRYVRLPARRRVSVLVYYLYLRPRNVNKTKHAAMNSSLE